MNKQLNVAKRAIQKAAEAQFKKSFNVICAEGAFSYVSHTNTFCQASVDGMHCYAFSF